MIGCRVYKDTNRENCRTYQFNKLEHTNLIIYNVGEYKIFYFPYT